MMRGSSGSTAGRRSAKYKPSVIRTAPANARATAETGRNIFGFTNGWPRSERPPRAAPAGTLLTSNLAIYGVGRIVAPLIAIKWIAHPVTAL